MKERVVCIEWDDAVFNSGYFDKERPKRYEQLLTKTTGFVIKSSRKEIIVGVDRWVGDDGQVEYRHITTIPKKMIKRVITLKEVKG